MEYDPEIRAASALTMQARVHPANPLLDPRALVSPAANWRKTKGNCPWCNEASSEPTPGWHPLCQRYYFAARGATHYEQNGKTLPLVAKKPCAKCGGIAHEINHIMPLGIARKTGGANHLKAWTPQNLQWLCSECHAGKTVTESRKAKRKAHNTKPSQPNLL